MIDPDAVAAARASLRFSCSHTRLPKLLELEPDMSPAEWLTVLGEEWSDFDNVGEYAAHLLRETVFAELVDEPDLRRHMMTGKERRALAALPDTVTIWRGCYENNRMGLSWSTDRAVAARFPRLLRYRQPGQALLIEARVQRTDIIALKLDRGEAEVIVHRPNIVSTVPIAIDDAVRRGLPA